jgi:heptosyltransferase-2
MKALVRSINRGRVLLNGLINFSIYLVGFLFVRPFIGKAKPQSLDLHDEHKILYVSLNYRGDLIINFPTISALKKHFPNCHLACWVRKYNEPIARMNREIDDVIVYDEFDTNPLMAFLQLLGGQKHHDLVELLRNFDIYFDDSGFAFTSIAAFIAKIPFRAGRGFRGFGFLNHHQFPTDLNSQLIERRLKALQLFGINMSLKDVPKPYFIIDSNVRTATLKECDIAEFGYFTVQPNGGWHAKNWGVDKYCWVSKQFSIQTGLTPIFLGSVSDRAYIEDAIVGQKLKAINLAGSCELDKVAAIIAAGRLHFGADSVGSQLAISLGVRSLTIFGPVNPILSSYLGDGNVGVIKRTKCMPRPDKIYCCFDAGRSCPRISWMNELHENDVLTVLEDVWEGKGRPPLVVC